MQQPSIFATDDWEVCESTMDGVRYIVRMRSTFPSNADQQRFDQLIIVCCFYQTDDSGLPDTETHRLIVEFEDALDAGTEMKGIAFQVLSLTGVGKRKWRYYASSPDDFVESLNNDLQGHSAYPLEIESFLDPDWTGLREFHQMRHA